jgi:acyl transferase domain-containing protein
MQDGVLFGHANDTDHLNQVLLSSAASFGVGGRRRPEPDSMEKAPLPRLLLFSAKHPKALNTVIDDNQSYFLSHTLLLPDLSYSLAMKREIFANRAFCVTDGLDDWKLSHSHRPAIRVPPKLVFTFSGQGAQWAQMGKALIINVAMFRESIEAMDSFLQTLQDGPQWSLIGRLILFS